MFWFGKTKKDRSLIEIESDKNFSIKPLFDVNFGIANIDLLETLGTGVFGRVRLVKSLLDKKYYALKIMKKFRIVQNKQMEHVQNEIKILSRLRSPFVAELYAVFQDDNTVFLLLEFIPGGELFSYLRKQVKFDITLYQFYTVEVACALNHLHEFQIAYRDIKPENILLDRNGHIMLTDFGFAKVITDERTYTMCGTPEYLSPEVLQGLGHGKAS